MATSCCLHFRLFDVSTFSTRLRRFDFSMFRHSQRGFDVSTPSTFRHPRHFDALDASTLAVLSTLQCCLYYNAPTLSTLSTSMFRLRHFGLRRLCSGQRSSGDMAPTAMVLCLRSDTKQSDSVSGLNGHLQHIGNAFDEIRRRRSRRRFELRSLQPLSATSSLPTAMPRQRLNGTTWRRLR